MSHKSRPHVSAGEYLMVHLLLIVGVLALTWGPLVYLFRAVAMRAGVGF